MVLQPRENARIFRF
jgi:hypothetical protein